MTSLLTNVKQSVGDQGFFISVANLLGKVNGYSSTGTFSTASWATPGAAGTPGTSTVSTTSQGLVLRDLGKTVVSSLRTFRKVQLVLPNSATLSTFGVGGQAATAQGNDYLTGYIELGFEGNGTPAPVAKFGR